VRVTTKFRFAFHTSWQGRRLALSRCIPQAAASLHKPTHFFARQTARRRRLCLGSNRGGLFVSQCTVWPLHHQLGEPPLKANNTSVLLCCYPQTPPWSGRFHTPLNPIDHAPMALRGVPAPWNPDHFMETKQAFAPLWNPTTNPMRIGCAPWYSPKETFAAMTAHKTNLSAK
jgi:hypothetical protein